MRYRPPSARPGGQRAHHDAGAEFRIIGPSLPRIRGRVPAISRWTQGVSSANAPMKRAPVIAPPVARRCFSYRPRHSQAATCSHHRWASATPSRRPGRRGQSLSTVGWSLLKAPVYTVAKSNNHGAGEGGDVDQRRAAQVGGHRSWRRPESCAPRRRLR